MKSFFINIIDGLYASHQRITTIKGNKLQNVNLHGYKAQTSL